MDAVTQKSRFSCRVWFIELTNNSSCLEHGSQARVISAMSMVAFMMAFLLGQGGNENLMHTNNFKFYSSNTDDTEH